ncbi:MAG: hypothetical protein NTZ71_19435 [Planctomycetota bacterium]|nr:hypothetical protein [Planctomycetota bacterium]
MNHINLSMWLSMFFRGSSLASVTRPVASKSTNRRWISMPTSHSAQFTLSRIRWKNTFSKSLNSSNGFSPLASRRVR